MKNRLWFFLLAVSVISGCASARMYPVQGPLSTQTPLPVFRARLTGVLYSGDISVSLANNEKAQGRWVRVTPSKAATHSGPSTISIADDMPTVWNAVYGPGFYTAHVLGQALYGQATITGDQGTVLHVEFYRTNKTDQDGTRGPIRGVAKDDKDNIYKLAF